MPYVRYGVRIASEKDVAADESSVDVVVDPLLLLAASPKFDEVTPPAVDDDDAEVLLLLPPAAAVARLCATATEATGAEAIDHRV